MKGAGGMGKSSSVEAAANAITARNPVPTSECKIMTVATTARRRAANRAGAREAMPAPKSTAYGRAVLRAIDRMKAAGPWKFAPKSSDRYFKR